MGGKGLWRGSHRPGSPGAIGSIGLSAKEDTAWISLESNNSTVSMMNNNENVCMYFGHLPALNPRVHVFTRR